MMLFSLLKKIAELLLYFVLFAIGLWIGANNPDIVLNIFNQWGN